MRPSDVTDPLSDDEPICELRSALRGAILRDAADLARARDVLVVLAGAGGAWLVEALVCGEHWEGAQPLELRREPLLLEALVRGRVVRRRPGPPCRLVGAHWSTAAALVPVPEAIAVFTGTTALASDAAAREAAALACLGGWTVPPEAAETGHAVVVARAAVPDALRRVRVAVAEAAPAGTHVVDLGGGEVCVLLPSDSPLRCRRVLRRVRAALAAGTPEAGVEIGWAIGTPRRPPARAVAVARAMVDHGGVR